MKGILYLLCSNICIWSYIVFSEHKSTFDIGGQNTEMKKKQQIVRLYMS